MRSIKIVFDPEQLLAGVSAEVGAKRIELLRLKIQKDPTVQFALPIRRALAVLADIRTPAALGLLKDLAKQDPNGTMGGLAAAALERAKIVKQPSAGRSMKSAADIR